MRKMKSTLLLGLTPLLVAACAIITDIPQTHPVQMNHNSLLNEDMRYMLTSIRNLMLLSIDTGLTDSERQDRVLRELDLLNSTARILKDGEELYGYSVADPYLGSFIHDISMAKEFALQSPPDYEPAIGLRKSCLMCHENL